MLKNEILKKNCSNEQYFVGRGIVVYKKGPKKTLWILKKDLRKPESTMLACKTHDSGNENRIISYKAYPNKLCSSISDKFNVKG